MLKEDFKKAVHGKAKYANADDLKEKICDYFDFVGSRTVTKRLFDKYGKMIETEVPELPTIGKMMNYLGLTYQGFDKMARRGDDFAEVVFFSKSIIKEYNIEQCSLGNHDFKVIGSYLRDFYKNEDDNEGSIIDRLREAISPKKKNWV